MALPLFLLRAVSTEDFKDLAGDTPNKGRFGRSRAAGVSHAVERVEKRAVRCSPCSGKFLLRGAIACHNFVEVKSNIIEAFFASIALDGSLNQSSEMPLAYAAEFAAIMPQREIVVMAFPHSL